MEYGSISVVINIEEYRARQARQPAPWSSFLSTAAGAFVIGAFSVLHSDKIPPPNQWMALLSGPAEADNRLSFSGTRVGRSETAPLLKICLARNVARDVDSGRAIDPTIRVEFLGSAANSAPQASRDHAALELATKWGAVADCVYRSNFSRLCDIDNRALAVQAASTFVVKADEIASTPDSYSATQPEVESLAQVRTRVLDSLQYLIKSGVLIASDFTTFAPASVRQALAKADPDQNACAKQ